MPENALSRAPFAGCSLGIPNGLYDCAGDCGGFERLKLLFAWACGSGMLVCACCPCDPVLVADVVPLAANDMPFTTPVCWALDGKEDMGWLTATFLA